MLPGEGAALRTRCGARLDKATMLSGSWLSFPWGPSQHQVGDGVALVEHPGVWNEAILFGGHKPQDNLQELEGGNPSWLPLLTCLWISACLLYIHVLSSKLGQWFLTIFKITLQCYWSPVAITFVFLCSCLHAAETSKPELLLLKKIAGANPVPQKCWAAINFVPIPSPSMRPTACPGFLGCLLKPQGLLRRDFQFFFF